MSATFALPGTRRVLDLPAGGASARAAGPPRRRRPSPIASFWPLVLGSGSTRASALDLSEGLLRGGLRGLASRSLSELLGESGLGRAQACRVVAAVELGARVSAEGGPRHPRSAPPRNRPGTCCRAMRRRPTETFGLLALDVRQRLKREVVVSSGCLTSSLVHPREVFQEAIVSRAAALVLFHNHPSGDPEPSAEDLALTRRLVSAGALLGIQVLDHLVLGAGRYVSLKERGVI